MYDVTNTFRELQESAVDMTILPVGAIEQHGVHLPLGADWMQADAIAKQVAQKLNAYVLPAMPFGNSQAHIGFRGTVSVSFETLAAVVKDIALSLLAQGFKKIVVLNLHGGNISLKIAVRELNSLQREGKVILVNPVSVAAKELSEILYSFQDEKHAGELETSLMLCLAEDLVLDGVIDAVPEEVSEQYFDYVPMSKLSANGIWGRASRGSRETGQKVLKAMVEKTVEHIYATFRRIEALEQESRCRESK